MEIEVCRDALPLPRWVSAWGHGFGDLLALICMNLIGKCRAYEAALEGESCRESRRRERGAPACPHHGLPPSLRRF